MRPQAPAEPTGGGERLIFSLLLRHLGSQLCELEKLIDKMMVEDFSMYARSDLSRSLREEPQVLEKV